VKLFRLECFSCLGSRHLTRTLVAATLLIVSFPALALFKLAANDYAAQVQQMYVAYYGRPGDPAGVEYWSDRLAQAGGNWIADLVDAFGNSDEYISRFGAFGDAQLIDNLYGQLFNRAAEPLGRTFYIDLLGGTNQSGFNPDGRQSTLAQIALDIANGAQNDDLTILQNKIAVAEYFTERVLSTGRSYTSNDIGEAVEIISAVDNTNASVVAARARVDDFVGEAVNVPPPGPSGVFGSLQITGDNEVAGTYVPSDASSTIVGSAIQAGWIFETPGTSFSNSPSLTVMDYGTGGYKSIRFQTSYASTMYMCSYGVADCSGASVDFNAQTVTFKNVQLVGGGVVLTLNGTLKYQ